MSNTPRTDAKEAESVNCELNTHLHYGWKFARQLETELAEARQQLAEQGAYAETGWAQARRLALELECLILSCNDTAATSKWWDSANEALDQFREVATNEPTPYIALAEHDAEVRRKALEEVIGLWAL